MPEGEVNKGWSMRTWHDKEAKWRKLNGGFVAAGIITGFFAGPALKFCDPLVLLILAASLGLAAFQGYERVILEDKTHRNVAGLWLFVIMAVASFIMVLGSV